MAAAVALTGGDPARAPALFRRYGCSGCHTIPGIPGADGQTGAPLTGLSKHVYIAGVLENRSDNLIAWIVSPQSFSPQTAMPKTGISEQEARDLAAYLYIH
jgi:cytochrome c1